MSKEKVRKSDGAIVLTPFEEKLRTVLLESGLTYPELTEKSGVSTSVVCRFVTRKRGLTSENFARLADAMGLDLCLRLANGRYVGIQIKDFPPRPLGRPKFAHVPDIHF